MDHRYRSHAQPAGLCDTLLRAGHDLEIIDPQHRAQDLGDPGWLEGARLVVTRGRTPEALCLLAWAERLGVATINTRAAVAAVQNKGEMAAALAHRGLPTLPTLLGPPEWLAAELPASGYPYVLKPVLGDNARGLRVVGSALELAALPWLEGVALAQPYRPGDGYDLKLYVIGDQVWAVRKPAPRLEGTETGGVPGPPQQLPVTEELRWLALACGALFGLELYGVDCLEAEDGPRVVEVNDFPNYTGVPDADQGLASYVARRARGEQAA
ncbi:MAG: ATP-grasp domain-containing protein [Acidimicrobiia bacterium]